MFQIGLVLYRKSSNRGEIGPKLFPCNLKLALENEIHTGSLKTCAPEGKVILCVVWIIYIIVVLETDKIRNELYSVKLVLEQVNF